MIRETLEMVPVALVLALVLGFAARPARHAWSTPEPFVAAMTADLQATSARLLSGAARQVDTDLVGSVHANRADTTGAHSSTRPQIETTRRGLHATQGTDASGHRAQSQFLPRRHYDPDVPFFTSEDLARALPPTTIAVLGAQEAPPGANQGPTNGPAPRQTTGTAAQPGPDPQASRILDLNTASLEQLVSVPGIGRARASLLVHNRPPAGYTSWDEVDALPGFGPAIISALRQHARIGR